MRIIIMTDDVIYRTMEYQSLYCTRIWIPYYKIKFRLQNNQNKLLLDLLRIIFLCWRSRTFWFCHSLKQKLHLYFSPFNYLAFNPCAKNMRHSRKVIAKQVFRHKIILVQHHTSSLFIHPFWRATPSPYTPLQNRFV